MQNRKLAGATVLSLALPGLIASLAVMPAANASIEADTGDADRTSFDTIRSDATMEQQCKWVLVGAPSSITLSPTTDGAEYNGDALPLSADLSSDISVHSTGNLDDAADYDRFQDCAFFNNIFSPTVDLSINNTTFEASVASDSSNDDGMDFDVTDSNALTFGFTPDSTPCTSWDIKATTLELTASTKSGTILDLASLSTGVTSPVTSTGAENDKCKLSSGSVSINIPEGKNPRSPGVAYNFTGPILTTSLSTTDLGSSGS